MRKSHRMLLKRRRQVCKANGNDPENMKKGWGNVDGVRGQAVAQTALILWLLERYHQGSLQEM